MPTTVSITDFRKNLFEYAEATLATGFSFYVYKDDEALWTVTPKKNNLAERTRYVIDHILPKLAGAWSDIPEKEFNKWKRFLRKDRKFKGW